MVDQEGKIDGSRELVALETQDQLRMWCKLLRCTEGDLRDALVQVGNSPEKVQGHLDKMK